MLTLSRLAKATAVLVPALLAPHIHALELPDCRALQQWAAQLEPGATVTVAPEVELTNILEDELVVPLFGAPAMAWSSAEFSQVRKALNQCRAETRDKARGRQLYDAIKAIDRSRGTLNQRVQLRAQLEGTVDRLVKYRPSRRLADQMALTRDVMRGKPADLDAHGLRRMPNWIRQVEQAGGYLTEAEMAPYAERLAAREAELRAEFEEDAEAFAGLQQELEAVPLSRAGLAQLQRLQRSPVLGKATPQQLDAFRAEVRRKDAQIRAQLRRQDLARAQQARPDSRLQRPVGGGGGQQAGAAQEDGMPDLAQYLGAVVKGDEVADATLLGLKPGVDHQQAIRRVTGEHGFQQTLTLSMTQGYGRAARLVEFTTMDDAVGQLDYTDYFKAPIDAEAVQQALEARYGGPHDVRQADGGRLMTWADGDQVLQVFAANRVHNAVRHKGYHSRLSLALWSEDYAEHLEEVNARCSDIWDKPRNELSMNDKLYLGQNCPLMPGNQKTPGINTVP